MTDLAALSDHLLAPLLESAAATLRSLPVEDVPGSLRPLLGFDRRGMSRGPARAQMRRALDDDEHFRAQVFADFGARPETRAVLDDWRALDALAVANRSVLDGSLPLLASALLAAAPAGADVGIGVIVAIDAAHRRARDDQSEADNTAGRVVDLEEGLRRADAARVAVEQERDVLADQLRAERRARRERDDRGASDSARVTARVVELEAALAREQARTERAEAELVGASRRVEALEAEVERMARAASRESDAVPSDPAAIEAAARVARELAATLEQLADTSGDQSLDAPTDAVAVTSTPTAPTRPSPGGGPAKRRARPKLPGGLVADTASGAGAMFRTGSVRLVVDGYNVSKTAWASTSLALERESLVRALHSLHLTTGVDVIVVFDGDGTQVVSKPHRPGVRVVFSAPGIEADSVVVEIVSSTPLSTPVVVASSDHWVREHSETYGALVISAATLAALLRQPPDRPASGA
jgi:predicted RNA-binding protein with PIN domain